MLNVGESNIIYIGSLQQLPLKLEDDYIKNSLNVAHYQSITDFLSDYYQSDSTLEISLIYIEFIDWDLEIRTILNTFNDRNKTNFIFIFENDSELQKHKMELNRISSYAVTSNLNLESSFYSINNQLEIINSSEELLEVNDLAISTETTVPVYIDAISENEIIVRRPSFSKEIENQEFELAFDALNLKITSKQNIKYLDNTMVIEGDFTETLDRIKNIKAKNIPYIKASIFCQKKEDIKDLFTIPNLSIRCFQKNSNLDIEYINSSQLIIINEAYVDNNPLSREILNKIDLKNQYIVIFQAKSRSKAYQKAYNYNKILLNQDEFSEEIFTNLVEVFRKKIESSYVVYDEWDSSSTGAMKFNCEITSLKENSFSLVIPFQLRDSSIVFTSFWEQLSGTVLTSESSGGLYSHRIFFVNATEVDTRNIRKLLNQLIYAKDNNITTFLPKSFKDFRYISLHEQDNE